MSKIVILSLTTALVAISHVYALTSGYHSCYSKVSSPNCNTELTCSGPNVYGGTGSSTSEGDTHCAILTFPSNCGVTTAYCGLIAVSPKE